MGTVADRKLRRFLFGRVTERMAEMYRSQLQGDEWEGRLVQLGTILHDRGIEAEVTRGDDGSSCRSSSSTPARITPWPRPTAPSARWSGRCSRRSSAAASG